MNRNFKGPLLISLTLALGVFAAYWPALQHGFVDYDDTDYVTKNSYVQAGLTAQSLAWVWTSDVARNWHPLTMISHMADCQLYGMKPWGHHFTSLLFHAANTVLLFLLLNGLTGARWRSAFVAALFALHPLHVESVAWIAERKDVLSTFFFLLTLGAYARYALGMKEKGAVLPKNSRFGSSKVVGTRSTASQTAREKVGRGGTRPYQPRTEPRGEETTRMEAEAQPPSMIAPRHPRFFYVLALVLFALGLMSKPMLVTTPFVLLLLDFWPLRRCTDFKGLRGPVLRDKIPFFILTGVSCAVTYQVQQRGGAVLAVSHFSVTSRIANAVISYARYLGKLAWPENLSPLYLKHGAWPLWEAALIGAVLIAVSIAAVRQLKARPYLAVGWFWYLGTLVPVIGLVQVGMQSMADRYTYIPLIGIFIVLAWGGWELAARWQVPRLPLGLIAGASLVACALLTRVQLAYWSDSETLFRRMIAVTPGNYMAHYNLANGYSRRGDLAGAVKEYEAALVAEPNYPEAHNNLGTVLLRQGKFEEAIAHHREAARLLTQFLYVFNLANALADGGKFAEAVATYQQALQLDPNSSQAHHNMGLALQAMGQPEQAAAAFRAEVQLQPESPGAELNLANRLADAGKVDEAITHYLAAQRLDPGNAETANGLGICYAMQNKFAEAEAQFRESIRSKADNPGAESNLGNALGAQKRLDEAIPHYQKALQIDTNDFQTHFNLGLSLLQLGRKSEAKEHFAEALRIHPDYPKAREALNGLNSGR